MTTTEAFAFAIARAQFAALVVVPQPLATHEHAEKMVRKDALKILDELEEAVLLDIAQGQDDAGMYFLRVKERDDALAEVERLKQSPCPYLRGDVTRYCALAETGPDYLKELPDYEYTN